MSTTDPPASFGQEGLWLAERMLGRGGLRPFNVPCVVVMTGELDLRALGQALDALIARHPAWRTTFHLAGRALVQRVGAPFPLELEVSSRGPGPGDDLHAHLQEAARAFAAAPFDLRTGPLVRAKVLRLSAREHALIWVVHHAVYDGWSRQVVLRDLALLYQGFASGAQPELPVLSLTVAELARRDRQKYANGGFARDLAYWARQLADIEPLALATDHPRPAVFDHAARSLWLTCDAATADGLRAFCKTERVSLYMVMLAAVYEQLAHRSGQRDLLFGSAFAGRGATDMEDLVGFLANLLVVRVRAPAGASFVERVHQVRSVVLEAFEHGEVPFELIAAHLRRPPDLSRPRLFQVVLDVDNLPVLASAPRGLQWRILEPDDGVVEQDLAISVRANERSLELELRYSTRLFEPATARAIGDELMAFLARLARGEAPPHGRARPRSAETDLQTQLVDWNRTGHAAPSVADVHRLIEPAARATPEALALSSSAATLTYRELSEQVERWVRGLQDAGVERGDRVGLCFARSTDMVVSICAVLAAGAAYVPLDPGLPIQRLASMARQAGAKLTLAHAATHPIAAALGVQVLRGEELAATPGAAAAVTIDPDDLAYVIFTSGSTGIPKGVAITHGGLRNYLCHCESAYPVGPARTAIVHSTLSFDLTVTGLLAPLAVGGHVILADEGPAIDVLPDALRQATRVDVVKITPAHLAILSRLRLAGTPVGAYVIGGEALSFDLLEEFRRRSPTTRLINEYGPTETVVGCSTYEVGTRDPIEGPVSIGRPTVGVQVYVLGEDLTPVPIGDLGELYIAGAQLARGYIGEPGLTAERFVPCPFSREPGARMYKTGDLVRYGADGRLEYRGRNDDQLKIAGYRIELGEIECALRAHPGVREVVVLARGIGMARRLVAFVQPASEVIPDPRELQEFLGATLAAYMIPRQYVATADFPLTGNGKIDRRALAARSS